MEESKVINNDNINNTDMSLLQSTIGGNATTNNTLNKDDLQEVTGGGGGIVTPTTIVDGSETSQQTGTLTPVLLILGDSTTTDEEPVLLEEYTTYKAVINSDYESNIPTITFESKATSWCDANYVIAVTESDKNIPVIYDSTNFNLSVSFTNNQDWCSVIFKSPLEVADQLKLPLNSDNFPDNSKIIVPVISCEENDTGSERNTTITFNLKNFNINHNIQMSVIQNKLEKLKPIMLYYDNGNYKKLVDCPKEFTLAKHNDAITDSSLQVREIKSLIDGKITYIYSISTGTGIMVGTPKDVYLGYEDTNKIFEGNLSSVMTEFRATLESDVTECSAKLSRADTTGASIKYSLNKCTANRTISFSYNKLPIFSINQIYDNSGNSWTIYVCLVNISDYPNNNGFALFDNYIMSSTTDGNVLLEISPNSPGQTIYAVMYTPDGKIIMDTSRDTIGTLLKNGNLRHFSGHDYLKNGEYKDLYLVNIINVNHYENGRVSTKAVTLDMDIYVYIKQQDNFYYTSAKTVNFSNTEINNHLGVYILS